MDRLVCGDVGFGKTEIAIRAAFRVAMAGKQVAVLCPTTVLAQQHFRTFEQRMGDYPITIRALSRFQGKKESDETLAISIFPTGSKGQRPFHLRIIIRLISNKKN